MDSEGNPIAEKAPDEATELPEDLAKSTEKIENNFFTESYSISDLFSPS